jgi:hypothetical protein
MPRYFTLEQAEKTLPHIRTAVVNALELKTAYQQAEEALRDLTRKVMLSGGLAVDRDSALKLRQNRDESASRLQEALNSIHEFGCLVKDLDIGLLDFPTLYHGREVYLCWRLGEASITFWHEVEDGFGGRKPIDDEFLQNHRGDNVS